MLYVAACDSHRSVVLKAEVLYAYNLVHQSCNDPFWPVPPKTLFNMARFLLPYIDNSLVKSVMSSAVVILTMMQTASLFGAYRSGRWAADKISTLVLPQHLRTLCRRSIMITKTQEQVDDDTSAALKCGRCNNLTPATAKDAYQCMQCKHPFIFSFSDFEVVPAVIVRDILVLIVMCSSNLKRAPRQNT